MDMNVLKMYTIRDVKTEAFHQPFYAPTDDAALRMWKQALEDETHEMGKHPEDYSLFRCGEFHQAGENAGRVYPGDLICLSSGATHLKLIKEQNSNA